MVTGGLDEVDRRLLSALREDGRTPIAELARTLGVARGTVTTRLERLVSSGTIIGFTVRVRDELDPLEVRAMTLIEVEGRTTDNVIRMLRGIPEIRSLHTTNGGWNSVRNRWRTSTECWAGSARSTAW